MAYCTESSVTPPAARGADGGRLGYVVPESPRVCLRPSLVALSRPLRADGGDTKSTDLPIYCTRFDGEKAWTSRTFFVSWSVP